MVEWLKLQTAHKNFSSSIPTGKFLYFLFEGNLKEVEFGMLVAKDIREKNNEQLSWDIKTFMYREAAIETTQNHSLDLPFPYTIIPPV